MTLAAHDATQIIQHHYKNFTPKVGILLGSGLSTIISEIQDAIKIPYTKLPHFHQPSVIGHGKHLHLGRLYNVPIACLEGRPHFYEGVEKNTIKTMIRTLHLLGCDILINTNAAGSLHDHIQPGEVLLVKDHINFQFNHILVGPNDDDFGPRFLSMHDVYNLDLRRKAIMAAKATSHINLREGVYIGVLGPTFETPAEVKAYRLLGADIIGMSTIPEVIIARHCGMRVICFSAITNMAFSENGNSHDETLAGAKLASEKMVPVIKSFMDSLR